MTRGIPLPGAGAVDIAARRLTARFLESACSLTHPIVHHRPWLFLPLPVCPLATLSDRLDQWWKTGVWKTIDVEETEQETCR